MRIIFLMLMTRAIPLGIAGADVHAASNQVTQIKVCLTSIGWCTDYTPARSTQTTSATASTISKLRDTSPRGLGFSHRSHASTEGRGNTDMRNGLILLAALLVPLGPAEAKINISRDATESGPPLCLINGFYRDLGHRNCECRHASGRIVRRNATIAPLCK
jgi:hypothetical protein